MKIKIRQRVEPDENTGLPGVIAGIAARRAADAGASVNAWLNAKAAIVDSECEFSNHMSNVAGKCLEAVRATGGKPVAIFSDYDVDGCTSSTIIAEAMAALRVAYSQIPSRRHEDGYGFATPAAAKLSSGVYGAAFVLDCGTVDHDSVSKVAGVIPLFIIDHHLPNEDHAERWSSAVGDAPVYLVNPKLSQDPGPYDNMCTAGLSLQFSAMLMAAGGVEEIEKKIDSASEMAAIGTVADMARLDIPNRAIVGFGISKLAKTERHGVRRLLELFKAKPPLSATDISWRIAPAINSPGRLGSASVSLTALSKFSRIDDSVSSAEECFTINSDRKKQTESAMAEAREEIGKLGEISGALVVGSPWWNSGIVGLVAGRLVHELNVPVFVYGKGQIGSDLYKGSCRAPDGMDVYGIMGKCKHLLAKWGGHKAAGGFSIDPSNVEEFRAAARAAALDESAGEHIIYADAELDVSTVTLGFVRELKKLEPFGIGNPEPVFACYKLLLDSAESFGENKNHTRIYAVSTRDSIERTSTMTWWRKLPSDMKVVPGRLFDVLYKASLVNWRGKDEVQITVEAIRNEYGQISK